MPLGQLILGINQQKKAKEGLRAIAKEQMPGFDVSPELRQAYDESGQIPVEQTAGFRQSLGQLQSGQQFAARQAGTGAAAQGAALSSQNIQGLSSYYAQAAAGAIRHKADLALQIQSIQDAQSQADLQYRLSREEAYGKALAAGQKNITGAYEQAGADVKDVFTSMYGGGIGGGGGSGNATERLESASPEFGTATQPFAPESGTQGQPDYYTG